MSGIQHYDGSVSREIVIGQLLDDEPLTFGQARQIARSLLAAADEVERRAA